MIKAVIFGFNGVIYNSTVYIAKARGIYLEKLSVKRSEVEIAETLGRALQDQIKFWNQRYGTNLDYKTFSKETRRIAKQLMIEANIKPNEGVVDLLKDLKANKIKVGIASFMPKDFLFEDLKMLGFSLKDFDAITALEDVKKYRPDPEFLLTEAKNLGVKPEECVYISDDNEGLSVAESINIKTVGLINKFQKEEDFKNVDLIINSIKDLDVEKIMNL